MKKLIIKDYMTPSPHTIGAAKSLAYAEKKMHELGVRHLPVLKGGELVGILSDRDIKFVEAMDDMSPEEITVEQAASDEPYSVQLDATLKDVCSVMAEKKYGSVLVMEGVKLVGIFTWIDALKAFTSVL